MPAAKPDTEEGADEPAGMEASELKPLLRAARKQPVSCAMGTGPDGFLIVMDRIKAPKALLAQLRKDCPKLRTPGFGTASVGSGADAKLVTFEVNKEVPGLQKRIRASLKGTGFNKVSVGRASAAGPAGGPDDDGED